MSDVLEIPVSKADDPDGSELRSLLQLNLRHEAAVQRLMLFAIVLGVLSIPDQAVLLATDFVGGRAILLGLWGAAFIGGLLQVLSCARLRMLLERGCRRAGAKRIKTAS